MQCRRTLRDNGPMAQTTDGWFVDPAAHMRREYETERARLRLRFGTDRSLRGRVRYRLKLVSLHRRYRALARGGVVHFLDDEAHGGSGFFGRFGRPGR